ncbi:MAG: hypothetical protein EZS28_046600, partial [Streblomastix strix]
MVLKLPKGCWQVKTAMFKGHDTGVNSYIQTVRRLEHLPNTIVEFLDEQKKEK